MKGSSNKQDLVSSLVIMDCDYYNIDILHVACGNQVHVQIEGHHVDLGEGWAFFLLEEQQSKSKPVKGVHSVMDEL